MNRILALSAALLLASPAAAQVFDESTLAVAGELRERALDATSATRSPPT